MRKIRIRPKLESKKDYAHWVTIGSFVVFMLWLISLFVDEYHLAGKIKQEAKNILAQVEEHNARVDASAEKSTQQNQKIIIKKDLPPRSATPGAATEVLKSVIEDDDVKLEGSKIEIDAWIVKVAMSNEASWTAIFKIIATVLSTFFGVRLINFLFKRLEAEPRAA